MTDYFFISSPLHFFLSANISILSPTHQSVAIIISKNSEVAALYASAAEKFPEVFDEVILLPASGEKLGTFKGRKRLQVLKELFSRHMELRIFTGNDRRIEFQYAIHMASKFNAKVEGIYIDEGMVTYAGHSSIGKIQHLYIDPALRKLFYGRWWKNAITTGASPWIDSAYVAFPDAVHPLLRSKKLVPIDSDVFRTDLFRSLAAELLRNKEGLPAGIRAVICLPHEHYYTQKPDIYNDIRGALEKTYAPERIAVKPHPRIKDHDILKRIFPGFKVLDHGIGMEILLPLMDEGCVVIGDISSTLLTTKWLRPDLPVFALTIYGDAPEKMADLYQKLHIPVIEAGQLEGEILKSG